MGMLADSNYPTPRAQRYSMTSHPKYIRPALAPPSRQHGKLWGQVLDSGLLGLIATMAVRITVVNDKERRKKEP